MVIIDPYQQTKETEMTTKHNHQLVFGRKEADCPRCEELKNGASPVKWASSMRKEQERNLAQAIRNHNCKVSRCAVVCTAFDW
jgi:hypothetical protein